MISSFETILPEIVYAFLIYHTRDKYPANLIFLGVITITTIRDFGEGNFGK
jgi:hypothetical protein